MGDEPMAKASEMAWALELLEFPADEPPRKSRIERAIARDLREIVTAIPGTTFVGLAREVACPNENLQTLMTKLED
jgi:hypothetical protein